MKCLGELIAGEMGEFHKVGKVPNEHRPRPVPIT